MRGVCRNNKLLLFIFVWIFVASIHAALLAADSSIVIVNAIGGSIDNRDIQVKAGRIISELEQENGTVLDIPINIYIYLDRRAFKRIAPKDAAGFALPAKGEIYLLRNIDYFDEVLAHELAHIIFLRSLPGGTSLPDWFIEGLAIYQSKPTDDSFRYQQKALQSDLERLQDLDMTVDPRLSASKGYLAVTFIVEKYGQDNLKKIIHGLQAGEDFQAAMESGLGADYSVIESDWDIFKSEQRFMFDLAVLQYVGLTIIGLLAIITPFIWRWRSSRKMEEMDNEDSEYMTNDELERMIDSANARTKDYYEE